MAGEPGGGCAGRIQRRRVRGRAGRCALPVLSTASGPGGAADLDSNGLQLVCVVEFLAHARELRFSPGFVGARPYLPPADTALGLRLEGGLAEQPSEEVRSNHLRRLRVHTHPLWPTHCANSVAMLGQT